MLDPDSINNNVPGGATLSHSTKFGNELLNNGATVGELIRPVTENDCSARNDVNNPCIIFTCEWEDQIGQRRCGSEAIYTDYYSDNNNQRYGVNDINPFWFYRLDELRGNGTGYGGTQDDTVTLYTLYYFQQLTDGSIVRQDLASYAGQSRLNTAMTANGVPPVGQYHASTDLSWVSPGAWNDIGYVPTTCQTESFPRGNGGFAVPGYAGSACPGSGGEDTTPASDQFGVTANMGSGFEINVNEDIPGIVEDKVSNVMYVYLDVDTVAGSSENGFEIWAGPPHAHFGFSSNVNARNIQMTDLGSDFDTGGVSVFSSGILPLNSMTNNRVEFPLVYVSPEFAGQRIEVSLFDADSGTNWPICFYFDTIPNPDCNSPDPNFNGYLQHYDGSADEVGRCFPSCNNQFVEPPFFVDVPSFSANCDTTAPFEERMLNCNTFLGGRLMVSYDGGQHDTYQWLVNFPSVPYIKN